jgi:creatinine amidohydrolase/Fe(II)-dependent formamide hydrolase-like protein
MFRMSLIGLFIAALPLPGLAQAPNTVFIEELTWTEVRDAIKAGRTTVILPTGGTEQNGPHMVLGKHNFIVRHTAERIARSLGNALVAPVLGYVPEGNVDPPSGHMRYPGAITLPEEHYRKVVEFAARSFRVNGFKNIVLIGDSGGNQGGLKAVASMLNAEWAATDVRVHFASDYYQKSGQLFRAWLESQGEKPDAIGTHAGITDTSQLMAIDPTQIRMNLRAPGGGFEGSGVSGDPSRASVAYGQKGLELKVETTVAEVKALILSSRR